MIYVIDTHALIWLMSDHPRLGKAASATFESDTNRFAVPAIVVAEALFLIMRKRANLTFDEFWRFMDEISNLSFIDLTKSIIRITEGLPYELEMHDRQIIATALSLQQQGDEAAIITKDRLIIQTAIVPTVWD